MDLLLLSNRGLRTLHSHLTVAVRSENSSFAKKKQFEKCFHKLSPKTNQLATKRNQKHRCCYQKHFVLNQLKLQTYNLANFDKNRQNRIMCTIL